jgi:CheY-like chemotaxis protein
LLEIADTGIGIPPEKQVQIFEPFVQVDTRRPFEQQGTGLGLSIVQRLVERMGGTIELQSALGVGSTFRVRLQDVSISARLAASASPAEEQIIDFNDLASAEILIVDDNAVNRRLLESTFDGTHHRVRFATNGREAVEAVRSKAPDVVLMDIRMPEMDGQTALAEIRKIPGSELLPVIAVTASSMVEDEQRLRGAFAGYLRKPFTRAMLFRELSYFIPKHTAAGAARQTRDSDPAVAPILATPERWPALVQTLRRLERNVWPDVRDGGAISETRQFAAELKKLATSHGCPSLASYAEGLLKDADNYSAQRIEEHLARFPGLVRDLAEQSPRAGASQEPAGRS